MDALTWRLQQDLKSHLDRSDPSLIRIWFSMRLQKLPKIRIRTTYFCPPSRQAHFNFPSSFTAFYAIIAKIVKQMHREKINRILGGIWGSWYKIPFLLVGVQTHKQPPPNPKSQSQFSYSILARFSSLADRQHTSLGGITWSIPK